MRASVEARSNPNPTFSPPIPLPGGRSAELRNLLRRYYEGRDHLRRGICLLSAGEFDRAIQEFAVAAHANPRSRSLAAYLATAYIGEERFDEAAAEWEKLMGPDAHDVGTRVRHGLTLWKAGRAEEAMTSLREAVREFPESAEFHFQLGNMLAEVQDMEEAELRFTQAVTLDKGHSDAWIGLAMCHGVRGDVASSVQCLEKAQSRRPDDPRVGLLLAYALKAARESGGPAVIPVMAPEVAEERQADVEALSALIESEPDFVEAVLSLDGDDVRPDVFGLLATTLRAVLERHPEHADLHYHCGCVLARLGRTGEAIESIEQAVGLKPRYIKALIQLAKLYSQSDRDLDARHRLEEAIRAGAEYADVYLLLGNLYREGGERDRAVAAYRRALRLNPNYQAARQALETVQV